MQEVRIGRVIVFIGNGKGMEYPAHHRELRRKMKELNALIFAVETGRTEPWL